MESENIYQTMDAITNAICDSCEPRIRPEVTLQTVDDKTIIIVEVLPGSMRPYYIKSKGMMNITLNTLTSWGILREEHGNVMPTNAYALLNGKMPMRQHIAAIWNRDSQNLQGMRRIWFARTETYRF